MQTWPSLGAEVAESRRKRGADVAESRRLAESRRRRGRVSAQMWAAYSSLSRMKRNILSFSDTADSIVNLTQLSTCGRSATVPEGVLTAAQSKGTSWGQQ